MEIYNLTGCNVYLLNQKNELITSCPVVKSFQGDLTINGKIKRLKAYLATLPAYTKVIIAQEHMEQLSQFTKHLRVWSIPKTNKVQLLNSSFIYRVTMKG